MTSREDIPMTVEWIRKLRTKRFEQTKHRPRREVWETDRTLAERIAREFGLQISPGPIDRATRAQFARPHG